MPDGKVCKISFVLGSVQKKLCAVSRGVKGEFCAVNAVKSDSKEGMMLKGTEKEGEEGRLQRSNSLP